MNTPLLFGVVAILLGGAVIANAERLEAWSARIHRRSPHLLPLRRGSSDEYRLYVWVNRLAGVVLVCLGAALVLLGLLHGD